MIQSECANMDLEGQCKAVLPFLALFPSITVPPSLSNVNDCREMSSYFSNGVLLFDALSVVAPSYFHSSISREHPKDNYILKQSNLRKLLQNLQTYLRVEHGKKVCFPTTEDTLQDFILKIAKVQHWDSILFLLEVVAAAAVTCDQKAIFVGRVREMSNEHQLILKDLIQRGKAHLQDDDDKADTTASGMEPDGSKDLLSRESQDASDNFVSSHLHHHKEHRRHSVDSESEITEMITEDDGASKGGNYTIQADKELIKQLQNELSNLHKLYTTKENEMALQQQRENELSSKLYELSARHKADMMQAESLVLVRERQVSEEYESKMAELEKTLKKCQASLTENNKCKEQMDEMRDEMDVLKHTRDKAIQTEQRLLRLKEKLQNLQDVGECLKREEQAHSETIEKCIRLESEIATLQPLRRQLDDYKGRLVDVEIKLAEFQQDNATLRQKHDLLYQENAALKRQTCQQKEEELALRRQLAANDPGVSLHDDFTSAIGVGLSEFNPELKDILARLRSENEQLKIFAGENAHVQKMKDELEASRLLSQKLKEQHLSNKLALEESMGRENELRQQLTEAIYREEVLKTEILSLHTQFAESEKTEKMSEATHISNGEFLNRLQHQKDEAGREKNEIIKGASQTSLDLQQQHKSNVEEMQFQHQLRIDEILMKNEEDRKFLIKTCKNLMNMCLTDEGHRLKEMETLCREIEKQNEVKLDLMKKNRLMG
jgi:protein HOOK3